MKATPQLDQGDLFMSKAPWFDAAQKYLGLKEIKGSKHAPLIVQMWARIKLAGIKDDETPWCAAFVGSCLEEVGIQSSRSAAALSYVPPHVMSVTFVNPATAVGILRFVESP